MQLTMAPALRPESNGEHPVAAWVGIAAVVTAILLILWARIEVHGTHDLEQALSAGAPKPAAPKRKPSPGTDRADKSAEVDDAVAAGRWAGGFSP